MKNWLGKFIPLFVLVFFASLYLWLQSPGITGGDAGDLVTAAVTKGVAHPPGYPLYTLSGWLVSRLPFGPTPAYRLGLLSSLPAAFSVFLAFLIAKKISKNNLIGLIASLSLAFNYLFWYYAEVQEVFSLHLLFLLLTLFLALAWLEKPRPRVFLLLALIAGLEFSHHHTYILILPALAFLLLRRGEERRIIFKKGLILKAGACFLIGASFYLYIPWAAAGSSPINWGHVDDLPSFLRLILRSDYGTLTLARGYGFSFKGGILSILGFFYFLWQEFTSLGILLILGGAYWSSKSKRTVFQFCLIWFLTAGIAFQFYAGFPIKDFYSIGVSERFYLLIYPVLLVWLVFGLVFLFETAKKITGAWRFLKPASRKLIYHAFCLLLLLYPGLLFLINFKKNDFRGFYAFDDFGKRLLNSCPEKAVFINAGDLEVFTVFYAQYVLGQRPDLLVINSLNPKTAVFYYPEFSKFRSFFGVSCESGPTFWSEFKHFLSESGLNVCSLDKLSLDETYLVQPRGLVYEGLKNQEGPDVQTIYDENLILWDSWWQEQGLIDQPKSESLFVQDLLETYYDRAIKLSAYFFKEEEYDKAARWLEVAQRYWREEEKILRMQLLIDIQKDNCDLAKEKLDKVRLVEENQKTLTMLEAIYKKECLGEGEEYERLQEELIESIPKD